MFLLQLDGPQRGGVKALMELASTRQGRQDIIEALNGGGSPSEQAPGAPKLRMYKRA